MRRIKNVALTIPCMVPAYTGVHCRLTLLASTTRIICSYETSRSPRHSDCREEPRHVKAHAPESDR
jgi:hypothetical protein